MAQKDKKTNIDKVCKECGHSKEMHGEGIYKGDCLKCAQEMSSCGGYVE